MLEHNLHLRRFSTYLQMDFYAGEKFDMYNLRTLDRILWKCYGLQEHLIEVKTIPTIPVQPSKK